MAKLLLLNLFLMFLWPALTQDFSEQGFVVGFLLGMVIISLAERSYGRVIVRTISFVIYVLYEIVLSNISLAMLILRPGSVENWLDPGIVGIPLRASTNVEITLLASVITLTPGTLSVDLVHDQSGQQILYVHNLRVQNADDFRESIQQGFERRILEITRGETA